MVAFKYHYKSRNQIFKLKKKKKLAGRNPTPPPHGASWVTLTGLWQQAGIYKRRSNDYGINNGASAILV